MSNYDNGFARAQRMYDNQLPPEPMNNEVECPECEGEGTIPCSDCCESEMRNGHCMECGENCVPAKCPTCEGLGVVQREKPERDYEED